MNFHQTQQKAIEHKEGPAIVIAGPGSGKTTVITHRIQHLIEHHQVKDTNILVITFTNAAAKEMKERFGSLFGKPNGVNFGTFHSVFFRILKLAYGFDAGNIIREDQKIQFIRESVNKLNFEIEDEADLTVSVLNEISYVKGEMLQLDHYYPQCCSADLFKKFYSSYEFYLKQNNLIDFDDMLVLCYELLVQRKDILSAWQNKYQYILVDEYQDINRIQYEIVRMMAKPQNNLFVVGDDDQSIYRFRGAKPEIMLGFEADYPGAEKILLTINYRCSETIVKAASRLIVHNQTRFSKDITAANGVGRPLATKVWNDAREETLGIVREINDYLKMGYQLSDLAVLYRTNQDSRLLIEKLMEYNIPFSMKDSFPSIYEHWITKNLLAYMKIAAGDMSRQLILQVINRPNRFISRDSLENHKISWEQVKSFYQDKDWMVDRVEQLQYDLSMIRTMKPAAAVNYIRKGIGYELYLKEYAAQRQIDQAELMHILDQVQESAGGFDNLESWLIHMEQYNQQLKRKMEKEEVAIDGVTLMTMHSSKGLEFKVVYIIDANEGITPHHKAVLDADLEEERRMFYVAMTRAKERLHIYSVKERYGKRQEISRFVRDYLQGESNGTNSHL